jgi:hypothetical protein
VCPSPPRARLNEIDLSLKRWIGRQRELGPRTGTFLYAITIRSRKIGLDGAKAS